MPGTAGNVGINLPVARENGNSLPSSVELHGNLLVQAGLRKYRVSHSTRGDIRKAYESHLGGSWKPYLRLLPNSIIS